MPSPSEISADRKGIGGVETIRAPEVHALQEPFFYFFTFLLFYLFHAMHELTPSAVAMADRILIAV